MPVTNTIGRFNVGRDCQIVLVGPSGQRVDLPNVTGFESKQETASVKIDRLDGQQLHAELPKGWTFSFDNERGNAALDQIVADIEAQWYDAGTISSWKLYQYVQETDGSSSTFQYDNVSVKYDDAGKWEGDKATKQRVSGTANRRRQV